MVCKNSDPNNCSNGKGLSKSRRTAICLKSHQVQNFHIQKNAAATAMLSENGCNPTLFFSSNSFRLRVFDCTGLHCFVATLEASSSPKHILCILGCMFFGHPATISYNETIRSEGGSAKEIHHDKEWWTVGR